MARRWTTWKLRDMVRNASGETIDLKAYEADMRQLIDTYIEATNRGRSRPSATCRCWS